MKVLVLSQAISDSYMGVIRGALPPDCLIDIITGSKLEKSDTIESPPHNPNSLKLRLVSWFKYYRFVIRWARRRRPEKYDLIFATSNPPINAYLGLRLKKIFHTAFIYMNWDLYPQIIQTSMKGIVPAILSGLWNKVNSRIYPKIDQILTIGSVMGETLNAPLKNKVDLKIISMFTDTHRMKPIPKKENEFCKQYDIADKFVVLYSGKMGLGHNLEILLEASILLKRHQDILFLFIGHGQKYGIIENWIKQGKSENVKLLPLQPKQIFPLSMASGDIGFISQEKKAAKCFMPSKTYDMMACGMAIVAYSEGNDDLSLLIKRCDMGGSISENSPEKLAAVIEGIYLDRVKKEKYGMNARRFAVEEFDVSIVSEKYRTVFSQFIKN